MSADGAAVNPELSPDKAIGRRDSSPDLALSGAFPNPEADVLRNSLSAVMLEYHEQAKKFASLAADHARQSQEIAALTAQNAELSRDLAAGADAAARRAAAEAERDDLRSKFDDVRSKLDELRLEYNELLRRHGFERERSEQLEKRLCEIESSTSWRATRRLRALFARHPRLRRFVTTIGLRARRGNGAV
jgi:chromosome segregation ATPase